MFLKGIRKSKRTISLFLAINLIAQLLFPLAAFPSTTTVLSSGGGTPVSASVSSMVNGYTGDFNYNVPLVTLPGPNGESVPVSLSYHAGIGVNQKSSWVGLGWDYNPGEITRQVVDAPDDYNGKLVQEAGYQKYKFGALYNKNITNNISSYASGGYSYKTGDIKTSYHPLTSNARCLMIYAMCLLNL